MNGVMNGVMNGTMNSTMTSATGQPVNIQSKGNSHAA